MEKGKVIDKPLCIVVALFMIGTIFSNLPSTAKAVGKFNVGDRVQTTVNLHVREGPGLDYSVITTEPIGRTGVVVCSKPQSGDGYIWWVVKYADGIRGWSAENWLEKIGSISVSTNLSVPYIHQCYDTRDDFDGQWACGATSAVMVLAYYGKIDPWPYTCSYPYTHVSDYGNYISEQYTSCAGYTFGDDPDEITNDASGNPAKGAYGYIHYPDGLAKLGRMVDYFEKHELDSWERYYPSESQVKAELDSGYPVPASTKLTPAGHWVVIKGYTDNGYYIVDDPNGCKPYKGDPIWGLNFNYCGKDVLYTWDEMNVDEKWIALVHPPINNPPNKPSALSQLMSDGATAIPEGGTTSESTVVFKGRVSDPDGDQVRLEIELRQISEAFTDEPTLETISNFVSSGTEVSITRCGLIDADYHWQYRAKDAKEAKSDWTEFGVSGNIDFTVSLNEPPQLSDSAVEPETGETSTDFYYYVTYFDPDGDEPSVKRVYIDGIAHTMIWHSASDSWITYRYGPKNLPAGSHLYHFYFEDGRGGAARLPTSGSYDGPTVKSRDVAITAVTPSKTTVGQGYYLSINATLHNQGECTEAFNVTAYANTTEIDKAVVTLTSGSSTTLTFTWDTTGWTTGKYITKAMADTVPGETDIGDNTYVDGWVVVTIAGDMDGDYDVDFDDIVAIAMAYGSEPGVLNWNSNADIDGDGDVDFDDVVIAAMNYRKGT